MSKDTPISPQECVTRGRDMIANVRPSYGSMSQAVTGMSGRGVVNDNRGAVVVPAAE